MKKFTFNRTQTAEEFTCSHCKSVKKSKNTAVCGEEKLCNGCYGLLLSKNLITK